jgi:hypothetical protein
MVSDGMYRSGTRSVTIEIGSGGGAGANVKGHAKNP